MSSDSNLRPNSDPRLLMHDATLIQQNHRILLDHHYYTYARCPGTCGMAVLRQLQRCTWSKPHDPENQGIPTSKTKCRHCAMLGRKNRTPTHTTGDQWLSQGYWLTKLEDGSIVHVARIIMAEKLRRPLTPTDRVRFLDQDPTNLDPKNLMLESEIMKAKDKDQDIPPLIRKTPAQVAAAALRRIAEGRGS